MGIGRKELLELASAQFDPGIDELILQAVGKISASKVMRQAFDILGNLIKESILMQKEVTLPGGIGKLVPRHRKAYKQFSRVAGKTVNFEPTITVKFVPSGRFSRELKLKKKGKK